ncbi:MAG TPA: glycosyltransferase family A protein [Nitrospirota bacterium]|nr:glycosyltransferase family A protein [Nitrospirota bacterium]
MTVHFSVVIPLYNKARFIRRALDSVLKQTVEDYEVIVVDDGSTDDGPELVAQYGNGCIRLIRQENRGESAARNRGIAEAQGEFTAFLDADDAWKPHYLHTIKKLIDKHPEAGAYATAYEIILPSGRVICPKFEAVPSPPWQGLLRSYFRSAIGSPPVCSSAVTIPQKVFREVGTFSVGVPLGADLDMWGRIAMRYPIAFSNTIGASYIQDDQHPASRKHYFFENPESVFVRSAGEAIRRGEIRMADLKDLTEYMTKLQLAVGYDCLVDGRNPVIARKIIFKTCPRSLRLKWKRYRILIQTCLPDKFMRIAYRIIRGA